MTFKDTKTLILDIIKCSSIEVTENTKFKKTSGIYMLYVNKFDDDRIVPIYVGQTVDIQKRYSTHIKEILALNRLTKEEYMTYQNDLFYNGRFKSCKIFKYMVDNESCLSDLKMIILNECEQSELEAVEDKYIKELKAEYFGFNQLESVSGQRKEYYQNMTDEEINQLMENELMNIENYLEYGYTKFNFTYAYGMVDSSKKNNLIHEHKNRIRDILNTRNTREYIVEDIHEYFKKRREDNIEAVKSFLVPMKEYNDFPLKSRKIYVPFPKLKKSECGVYFVISNTNRWYGNTSHCAEIMKVISMYTENGKVHLKEYLIENNSTNLHYFEKDFYRRMVFHKTPFQIATDWDYLYMISLSTEFKTGVNDYDYRDKDLWSLNDAISDVISKCPDLYSFKLCSNQSKKVIDSSMLFLDFLLEEKIRNRVDKDFVFEGTSFLAINNDLLKGSDSSKLLKRYGIKLKRVNDFERGLQVALKGDFSHILFEVKRSNDKSIKVIRKLSERKLNSRIVVIDNGGKKTRSILNEIKHIEINYSITSKDFLKKLLL